MNPDLVNPEAQALLQQLKDVVVPAEPGWWPPAIGWWVVMLLLLVIAAMVMRVLRKRAEKKQQNFWRTTALAEHERIRRDFEHNRDSKNSLAELSVLMRRVALAVEPRRAVASLTDDEWLLSLDRIGATSQYSNGAGRLLYRHQYQRELQLDDQAMSDLFDLTGSTIKGADPSFTHNGISRQEGATVAAL